ncbi:A/G-specific adenine glycosylase [Cordyceps javanica]|uniref:Adenine DNA glycosylase n=1 Tax=Cordyceps javanica TaxID=43265 RepID=A0A545VR83_9HYPO|nr:A/G-specific adenine glycosylase [Cordyceps javanica]TQW04232.1 A/G-specific adenine glycosylase [Cordyceps javanica]
MRGQTRTATRRRPASSRVAITTTTTTSPRPSPSASDSEGGASPAQRPAKRRKTASSSGSKLEAYRAVLRLASLGSEAAPPPPSLPPARRHSLAYHAPLLLCGARGAAARADFLAWFDSVSGARAMPWRKPWVDPSRFSSSSSSPSSPSPALRAALEKRAYEVWISEIMLQQTRVAVVVEYWNRWMARWPTIRDLAGASPDDVLAAWRGLGYYSRATRIHEAARLVVGDAAMDGLLPSSARDLADRIPGVGPYTAGAISCIAFGRPAPMVDGNVLRVLSRQLGLFGSVKTDKALVDAIWAAAEALVDAVALDGVQHPQQQQQQQQDDGDGKAVAPAPGDTRSDRPGRWGQALMELGSTVCTPKPNCGECPITSTCRAYGEGLALSKRKTQQQQQCSNNVAVAESVDVDMEDLCSLCEPFDEHSAADDDDDEGTEKKPAAAAAAPKGGKQAKLSAFFSKPTTSKPTTTAAAAAAHSKADIEVIVRHARRFPVKTAKKAVREEETLVCAVVRADGRYLLRKRPAKGLLAGLWEFPSSSPALLLQETKKSKAASAKTTTTTTTTTTTGRRAKLAKEFVAATLGLPPGRDRDRGEDDEDEDSPSLEYVGELGSVPWLFSHIKLTMHVHLFRLRGTTSDDVGVGVDVGDGDGATSGRWSDSVETESMGTGMRRCWDLVKQAV